jgi:outer membrane protein OmpA-like peptidoglycan-associated protein
MRQTHALWSISLLLLTGLLTPQVSSQEGSTDKAAALLKQALASACPAEREDLLSRSLAIHESYDAHFYLGLLRLDANDFSSADRELRRAFGLAVDQKQHAEIRYWQGRIYESEASVLEKAGAHERREAIGKLFEAELAYCDAAELADVEDADKRCRATAIRLDGKVIPYQSIVRGFSREREIIVKPIIRLRVHFDYNKHHLSPTGRLQATELGKAMHEPFLRDRTFTLIGHTDIRGSDAHNMDLSRRRAETVASFLVEAGIDADRICTEWRGKREPLEQGTSEQAHYLNRRVVVQINDSGGGK